MNLLAVVEEHDERRKAVLVRLKSAEAEQRGAFAGREEAGHVFDTAEAGHPNICHLTMMMILLVEAEDAMRYSPHKAGVPSRILSPLE
jgi:hypothetical protein